MKLLSLSIGLFLIFCHVNGVQGKQNAANGFASVNILEQNGTYGGVEGPAVIATNFEDLKEYCKSDGPLQIKIRGTIYGTDQLQVDSNKTIEGESCNSVITGFGFRVNGSQNVIIRNLTFQNGEKDAVQIADSTHHVWVDHCTFYNYGDGLLDITEGGDYITVSWNIFRNHKKVTLVGAGIEDASADSTRLHVTFHHNWYDHVRERCPRVRWGQVHVYNNYYTTLEQYGVRSTTEAQVLVQNNYFYDLDDPITGDEDEPPGNLKSIGNYFNNVTGDTASFGNEVFNPALFYTYEVEQVGRVPGSVRSKAGACHDLLTSLDAPSESHIEVFPNPSRNLLNIRTREGIEVNRWQLLSLSGKKLLQGASGLNNWQLSMIKLPIGPYLLIIESNQFQTIHKIIKN